MNRLSQGSSRVGRGRGRSLAPVQFVGMVLALLFVAACGGSAPSGTGNASDFLASAAEPGVVVVDVRTPGEYAPAHLSGAVNVDVEGASFDAQIAALDKGATYAIYCRSGRRAAVAADAMRAAGFTSLIVFDGSFTDLQAAGASVVAS